MDKLLESCSQGRFNAHIQIKDGSGYGFEVANLN